jgi:hypothetical protein
MTAQKWLYGDAWEEYPIEAGEVWRVLDNDSKVAVHNIFNPLPDFMHTADFLFVDPPWNKGNLTAFYTKAGRDDYVQDFADFEQVLFQRVTEIAPRVCYLEVGRQAVDKWQEALAEFYPCVQRWDVTYYRRNPCHILRGGAAPLDYDYSGMDEQDVIFKAAKIEQYEVMGDMCMGQGLVGMAAYDAGRPFVGTELNKRRLANLLQKLARRGAVVERLEGG